MGDRVGDLMPFARKDSDQYYFLTLIDSCLPHILKNTHALLKPFKSLPLKLLCRMLASDSGIRRKYKGADTDWIERVMEAKLSELVFKMVMPSDGSFYYLAVQNNKGKITSNLLNFTEIRNFIFERTTFSLYGRSITAAIGKRCRVERRGEVEKWEYGKRRLYCVQSRSASITYDNFFRSRRHAAAWAKDGSFHDRRVESLEC